MYVPFFGLAQATGNRRITPPRATTIIRMPGWMPALSRSACGMTTWYFDDTVTTLLFISISLSFNEVTVDAVSAGRIAKPRLSS